MGLATSDSKIGSPGVISHTGTMQRLVFGEYEGARSPRVVALHEACIRGGIDAEISTRHSPRDLKGEICVPRRPFRHHDFDAQQAGPIAKNPTTRALPARCDARSRGRGPQPRRSPSSRILRTSGSLLSIASHRRWTPRCTQTWTTVGDSKWTGWSGAVVESLRGDAVGIPTPMNRAARDILTLHEQGRQVSA